MDLTSTNLVYLKKNFVLELNKALYFSTQTSHIYLELHLIISNNKKIQYIVFFLFCLFCYRNVSYNTLPEW